MELSLYCACLCVCTCVCVCVWGPPVFVSKFICFSEWLYLTSLFL
uniref:Uncharacterized protein n=1 Tax=Anguilla anguilla TaxID=7936 RepID=A0A0E9QTH3_ANGAN